ncbi:MULTISPECIES: hypothetical protein [unclassified Sporosarcina]|nr:MULTISPECIES: hypothetical protein [unclassified Sporosarcina]
MTGRRLACASAKDVSYSAPRSLNGGALQAVGEVMRLTGDLPVWLIA